MGSGLPPPPPVELWAQLPSPHVVYFETLAAPLGARSTAYFSMPFLCLSKMGCGGGVGSGPEARIRFPSNSANCGSQVSGFFPGGAFPGLYNMPMALSRSMAETV